MQANNSGGEENGHKKTECEMEISPDGTEQWLPTAKPEETPYVGQQFKTVDQGKGNTEERKEAQGVNQNRGLRPSLDPRKCSILLTSQRIVRSNPHMVLF
nr:protein FAR1-RELATED SEQUENCE 5-like [Ipomoea batatas]